MKKYYGKTVYGGIAIAPVRVFTKKELVIRRSRIKDIEAEEVRLDSALRRLTESFTELSERADAKVGRANAELFDAYNMILDDEEYIGVVREMVRLEHVNAEFAVMETGQSLAAMFSAMENEYFKARSSDVLDVTDMLVRMLLGEPDQSFVLEEPAILLAEELSAAETIGLDRSKILGIATTRGSINSHAAIFARLLGIPAVVCLPFVPDRGTIGDGEMAILDGYEGTICLSPDKTELDEGWRKLENYRRDEEEMLKLADCVSVTKSGRKIGIYANAASISDVDRVVHYGAEGIGLFRSEFLYLDSHTFPDEDTQYEIYRLALEKMGGKKVVIRTMDIGADRQPGYFEGFREKNPALGFRAIRLSLKRPDIFKTQLRAVLRASVYGNPSLMYPMISSEQEIARIREIVSECAKELDERGEKYRIPEQGIMIETPSAAVMADVLAKKADFFAIGTNDLTQYTLALDRQNGLLDEYYSQKAPAVLRLIEMTVKAAREAGIRCEICGELAADESMTEWFIEMGVDVLSVAPSLILRLRKHVRGLK